MEERKSEMAGMESNHEWTQMDTNQGKGEEGIVFNPTQGCVGRLDNAAGHRPALRKRANQAKSNQIKVGKGKVGKGWCDGCSLG